MFWAGNFVLARAFSFEIPPITLAFIRWSAALVVLLPFIIPTLLRHRQEIKENWKILIILGGLSVAGFNTLAYTGLQSTTAINGTLLQSSMPVMILLLCSFFLNEKASLKQWFGVSISLAGVLLLLSQGNLQMLLDLELNVGDIWITAAMFVWGLYSIALRWKPSSLSALCFLSVTVIVGLMFLTPMAWWEMQDKPAIVWNDDLYMLVAYLAVFPSILSYLFWNYGVIKLGANRAGLFVHLMPLWGMLLSSVFLDEKIQEFHLWSIALIFTGIYLAAVSNSAKQVKPE